MTKIRNVSDRAVWVPSLDLEVPPGASIDAPAGAARDLCAGDLFTAAKTTSKTTEAGEAAP